METVNAIAKVRFGSARPQRIQLHKGAELVMELLCLEAGQKIAVNSGCWAYYVVTGKASVSDGRQSGELATGQLVAMDPPQRHTIANAGEGRLVVLAAGHPG